MHGEDGDSDQEEPCSTLSYEWVDGMTLPAINRGDTKYIALVMAKAGLLTKYADSVVPPLAAQYKWRIHRMTSAEANLMNAAKKDCPGECCRRPFTTEDIVVDLPSFLRFYEIVRDCVMLASLHPAALREGGWLQVNNAVCPYVWRSGIRYVPLLIINLAAEVTIGSGEGETSGLDGSSLKPVLVRVTPPELTFLNDLCTKANQNFRFDANTDLVSLIDVKLASNAVIYDLPPSNDPFDYALFLGRMDAETVAAGKLAIKAGWDQFLKIQQAKKSPAPIELTATSESLHVEEPVFVDDPEVIILSPMAADSEPPDKSVPATRTVISPSSTTKAAAPNARAVNSAPTLAAPILAALLDDPHTISSGNRDFSRAKEVVTSTKEIVTSRKEAGSSTKESITSAKEAGSVAKEGTKSKEADSRPKEADIGTKATASGTAAAEAAGKSELSMAAARHPCGRAAVAACHDGSISSCQSDSPGSTPNSAHADMVASARSVPTAAAAPATFPSADALYSAPSAVNTDPFNIVAAASPDGSLAASAGSPDVCAARDALVLPSPLVLLSPSPDSGFLSPLPSPTEQIRVPPELLQDGSAAPVQLPMPVPLPSSPVPSSSLQPDASAERIAAQYAVLGPVVRERLAQGLTCDGEVLRLLVWFVHIQQQLFALLRQQLQVVQNLRGHDRTLVDECSLIVNDMLSSTKFWLSRRHNFEPRTRAVLNHTLTCAVLQRRVRSHLNYLVGGLFYVDTPAAFENFTFLRNLVALALILQGSRHSHAQQPMTAYTIVERCKPHLLRHVTAWSAVKLDSLGQERESLQAWRATLVSVYAQVYKYADEKAAAAAETYRLESDALLSMQLQQLAAATAGMGAPGVAASAAAASTVAAAAAAAAAAVAAAAAASSKKTCRAVSWWPAAGPAAPAQAGLTEGYEMSVDEPVAYERPEAVDSGRRSGGGSEPSLAILATGAASQLHTAIAAHLADGSCAKRRAVSSVPGVPGAPPSADAFAGCLSAAHLSYVDGSSARQRKTPQAAAGSAAGSPSPMEQLATLSQALIAQPAHGGIVPHPPAASAAGGGGTSSAVRPVHTVPLAARSADAGSRGNTGRVCVPGGTTAVFCVHPLNGTPTPCIARGKEWWVLVRDAAHALYPSCTVDEFQLVLEEILGLQLVVPTAEDLHVLSVARAASAKPSAATEPARADGHDGGSLLVRCRALAEHRSKLRSYLNPSGSSS